MSQNKLKIKQPYMFKKRKTGATYVSLVALSERLNGKLATTLNNSSDYK